MTLIVETGQGLSDAESFASLVEADAYHIKRGNTAWSAIGIDADREQLLRKATDYLEQIYSTQWAGYRKTNTQALSWPRSYVPRTGGLVLEYYDSASVPVAVINACCELALKAATGELLADLGQVIVSEKVGPIDTTYDKYSSQAVRYLSIDAMLRPLMTVRGLQVVRS